MMCGSVKYKGCTVSDFNYETNYNEDLHKLLEHCKEMENIARKNKVYKKKRKHKKDKKRLGHYKCNCSYCTDSMEHKHKRSERIYTAEEYFYDPSLDYDYVFGGDWWTVDPWYAEEIGYGYLVHEEWRDYVDHTGKVLDKWDLMSKQREEEELAMSCCFCGTTDWCECF